MNRNFITTRNLSRQDVVSLGVSYPFSVAKWWNVYANLTAYHSNNRADFGLGRTIDLTANVLNIYSQHAFSLPNKWNIEVSGYYTSPSIWGAPSSTAGTGAPTWACRTRCSKTVVRWWSPSPTRSTASSGGASASLAAST